jgi:putative ATPase
VREPRVLPVPTHLRDASYRGAKRLGHGQGYQYAHDGPEGWVDQDYLGVNREYYQPTDRGLEAELRRRLEELRQRRSPQGGQSPTPAEGSGKQSAAGPRPAE